MARLTKTPAEALAPPPHPSLVKEGSAVVETQDRGCLSHSHLPANQQPGDGGAQRLAQPHCPGHPLDQLLVPRPQPTQALTHTPVRWSCKGPGVREPMLRPSQRPDTHMHIPEHTRSRGTVAMLMFCQMCMHACISTGRSQICVCSWAPVLAYIWTN